MELERYKPVEGQFRTREGPGRIVGNLFTLGILYLFRDPFYFVPVEINLEPIDPVLVDGPFGAATVEDRLMQLRRIHERGLITDEEYEKRRREIIDQL